MGNKAWKSLERYIAEYLGGQRDWTALEDVTHDLYSVEAKHRKQLPQWLHDAMTQAETNSPDGKVAIVVLHQKHQPREDCYVVMRLRTFREWHA